MEKNISYNDMHYFAICRLIMIIISNNDKLFIKIIHRKQEPFVDILMSQCVLLPHYLQ